MVLLVLGGGAMLNFLTFQVFQRQFAAFNAEVAQQSTRVAEQTLMLFIEKMNTRAFTLSQSPVLASLQSPPDHNGSATWAGQDQIQRLFQALLRSQQDLLEVHLLVGEPSQGIHLAAWRDGDRPPEQSVHHGLGDLSPILQQTLQAGTSQVRVIPARGSTAHSPQSAIQISVPLNVGDLPASLVLRSSPKAAFRHLEATDTTQGELYLLATEPTGRPYPLSPNALASPLALLAALGTDLQLQPGKPTTAGDYFLLPTGKPEQHGHWVLAQKLHSRRAEAILSDTILHNLRIQAVILAILLLVSYHMARYLSRPITELGQVLSEKRETVDWADMPEDADADLQSLFQVIVQNAQRIRSQQTRLSERLQTVTELREKLEAAYLHLQNVDEERNELIKVAAHDLKEPLLVVRSCGDLLPDLLAEGDQDGLNQAIGFMETAILRMSEQLERMRRYFSIGNASSPTTRIALRPLCTTLIESLEAAWLDKPAQVHIHGEAELLGNTEDLHTLLLTLLENAFRYRRDHAPCVVQVHLAREEAQVRIAVEDNGMGIDPENHERIFNLFYRSNNSDGYRGTGTSLAECRKVAHLHMGEISVRSNPEHGCTFEVILRDRVPNQQGASPGDAQNMA